MGRNPNQIIFTFYITNNYYVKGMKAQMKRIITRSVSNISLDFEHLMNIYGISKDSDQHYSGSFDDKVNHRTIVIEDVYDEDSICMIDVQYIYSSGDIDYETLQFYSIEDLINYLDEIVLNSCEDDEIDDESIYLPLNMCSSVLAAISTRDLTKNLVRVKSSNMWAYTINIRDRKDKVGDVLVQFKGKNGGPGDIYLYYDVPVNLWRRWLAAPSKGHFFWVNVRNEFQYRKLTGNKRGVLPNAVN